MCVLLLFFLSVGFHIYNSYMGIMLYTHTHLFSPSKKKCIFSIFTAIYILGLNIMLVLLKHDFGPPFQNLEFWSLILHIVATFVSRQIFSSKMLNFDPKSSNFWAWNFLFIWKLEPKLLTCGFKFTITGLET